MKIITNKKKLIEEINGYNDIGFVPTMGALHNGHISLIKKSIFQSNKTIVSIFINKPQFNKKKDFIKYPRNNKKDILLLKKLKIDILYLPTHNDIYPSGPNKNIKINKFSKELCGKFRPKHFESIVDVVERFVKIINPKRIYFGQKDFQQLLLVEDYIKKNLIKTKVIKCKTIREKTGLAYSSRNMLLTKKEKLTASKVFKFFKKNKSYIFRNNISIKLIKSKLLNFGIDKVEYIKYLNINKIIKPYKKNKRYKVFIAYYINSVRLIDNI